MDETAATTGQKPAYPAASQGRDPAAVWRAVHAERVRAHAKHGDTSMENLDPFDLVRLTVLMEEVGEVARAFNEGRHAAGTPMEPQQDWTVFVNGEALYEELIQVAAMAGAWADNLGEMLDRMAADRV